MKTKLIYCLIALILSSCSLTTKTERAENRRQAKCIKHGCNQGTSDSVMVIRETLTIKEDTTIYIKVPGESKTDTLIVEKDKSGFAYTDKSILKTSFAISSAWVENGILRHELQQKDSTIVARIKDAIRITQIKESKKHVTQKPPERINYITTWQKILIASGYILLIGIVIAILIAGRMVYDYLKTI